MKKITSALLVLLLSITVSSSAQEDYKMQWGKVPSADLKLKSCDFDPDASALILGDDCIVQFHSSPTGLKIRIERHIRIKIFNEKGYNQANIELPYYSADRVEYISDVDAQIFSPSGEKVKLSRKDIFTEKVNSYWSAKKFTFPKVENGSIIEYRYELFNHNLTELTTFYFQNDIPTRWSQLYLEIPEYITYQPLVRGGFISDRSTDSKRGNFGDGLSGLVNTFTYGAKKLPPVKDEPFVNCIDDYKLRIFFQYKSYIVPGRVYEENTNTWANYAGRMYKSDYFGKQYKSSSKSNQLRKAYALQRSDEELEPKEEIAAIFRFITENIKWNGNYGEYNFDSSLDEPFEKGEGNIGAINLALVALLRANGFDANPGVLGTRSNGVHIVAYPQRSQFNYVIACLEVDGKLMFIDASNPQCPPGVLPERAMNNQVLVIKDETYGWKNLTDYRSDVAKLFKIKLDEEGTVKGTVKERFSNNAAISKKATFAKHDGEKDFLKTRFYDEYASIEVEKFEVINKENLSASNKLECSTWFTIPEYAQVSDSFIYINPFLNEGIQDNPFDAEERIHPINFPYLEKKMTIVELEIPEGYAIEDIPEGENVSLEDKGLVFKFSIRKVDNMITCISSLEVKKILFAAKEYIGIRKLFELAIEKQNEQIVLKKI